VPAVRRLQILVWKNSTRKRIEKGNVRKGSGSQWEYSHEKEKHLGRERRNILTIDASSGSGRLLGVWGVREQRGPAKGLVKEGVKWRGGVLAPPLTNLKLSQGLQSYRKEGSKREFKRWR